MQKLTGEWLRKAESDLRVADLLAKQRPKPADQICFHCQQAVEKFLKGLIQERAITVPRIHDLEALYQLLAPIHSGLGLSNARLSRLTQYAVDYRYPGIHARSKRAVGAALRETGPRAVRKVLGLPVNPGKRRRGG